MQEANLGHISIGYDSKLLKITGQQKPNGETCHGVLINIIHIIRTSIYLLNVSSVTVKGTLATKILLLFFEGGSCCMASCYFKNLPWYSAKTCTFIKIPRKSWGSPWVLLFLHLASFHWESGLILVLSVLTQQMRMEINAFSFFISRKNLAHFSTLWGCKCYITKATWTTSYSIL